MAYNSKGGLPFESASKLGHLSLMNSNWINSLVKDFEAQHSSPSSSVISNWIEFNGKSQNIIDQIWVVDGSYVPVQSDAIPPKEVAFIKTAILNISETSLKTIDKYNPHPMDLQKVMKDSALFHSTVLPLRNIKSSRGTNFETIRNIIFESIKIDEKGEYFETLKWLSYQKWLDAPTNSPSFNCPYCESELEFTVNEEKMNCTNSTCSKELFLTDMIGFHLDMTEERATDGIASAYMTIMEHLMLFTIIRLYWNRGDKTLFNKTLFIKDGPLSLNSQYVKLVPRIRDFLQFAKEKDIFINIIGQEKSGKFVDHLSTIGRYVKPFDRKEKLHYHVLTHAYVESEVQDKPSTINYGKRSNWGEKIFVKVDPVTQLVINVPTGNYLDRKNAPLPNELINLEAILNILPNLVSRRFSGGLYPIELANGIASLSSYPSARILQQLLNE
ncbi:hypothetical protein [Heyndrickxia oleronia]|uniref:hypothetical protein n=1 Tax=Heyndrickxia oleronia TaxID=38875 RepID=UPI001B0F345B|nr:hypothetical protein [Heyndrickxia oleronia]GIN41187.1 hypothetical protein J19TS1_41360 [Heyndrickxia oleronia]